MAGAERVREILRGSGVGEDRFNGKTRKELAGWHSTIKGVMESGGTVSAENRRLWEQVDAVLTPKKSGGPPRHKRVRPSAYEIPSWRSFTSESSRPVSEVVESEVQASVSGTGVTEEARGVQTAWEWIREKARAALDFALNKEL